MKIEELMRPAAVTALALGMLLGAGAANAALLDIVGGTPVATGTAPGAGGVNNVLGDGYVLQDNAVLQTTANNVTLTYYFWGSESGFDNELIANAGLADELKHTEDDNIYTFATALKLGSVSQASAGDVKVKFNVGNGIGDLLPRFGDADKSIAFAFLNADGSVSATKTNIALISLDDSGAGPDDNHDDYVGYVVATPIPAAAWLFGSAIIGTLVMGHRRKTANQGVPATA